MRKAIITEEWIDEDVCYGDYDGHITRKIYEVAFFTSGGDDAIDRHYYKTEDMAHQEAAKFERGEYRVDEYGGIAFDRVERVYYENV